MVRFAGLLFVLAGLFGMHGLASHGAAAAETSSEAAMTGTHMSLAASDVAELADQAAALVGRVVDRSQGPGEIASGSPHTGMDMTRAMMCVAILTVGLIALLRLLLGARVGPFLQLLPRQALAFMRPGRDPDPPWLIALSIQRC